MIDFRYSGFVGVSAAVLLMAACTNDEAIRNITPEDGSEKTAVVKFAFQVEREESGLQSKITRDGDPNEQKQDVNYVPDKSVLEGESDINNVRIFYFPVNEANDFSGKYNEMTIAYDKNNTDGSKYYPIPYITDENYEKGRYHFYALVNNTDFKAWDGMTEKDFRDAIVTYSTPTYYDFANRKITSNGLPMASRRSDDNQVTITGDADRLYVDGRLLNGSDSLTVSFIVERGVAKVVYQCKKAENVYPITIAEGTTTYHLADVTLNEARICGKRNSSYLFRHVGTFESSDGLTGTMSNVRFGALGLYNSNDYYSTIGYFVLDPTFEDKYNNVDKVTFFSGSKFNELDATPDEFAKLISTVDGQCVIDYPLENTMPRQMQQQHVSTGVVFKASLTPDAERYFVQNGGNVVLGTYAAGQDLYYCDGYFADSKETLEKIPALKNTGQDITAKTTIYKGGICYYVYWIREITAGDPVKMNNMEFCIVRNTAYYVGIDNVKGLGAPTASSSIIEGDPDKGRNLLIDVTIQVFPWIRNEQGSVDIYSAKARR